MGGGLGGWVTKRKRLSNRNWSLQNTHGNVKYSMRKTVSNIVITRDGVRWALDLPGSSLCKSINV